MKCLILHGSPSHRYAWAGGIATSYTKKLVDEVCRQMTRLGPVEFEEIVLADLNLPLCIGCYNCFFGGDALCPHATAVQGVVQQMLEADCVILTSPVYALHVTAVVKNFIDHTAYLFHRPSLFGKKGLVVSSTAGAKAGRVCAYLRDTMMHWGFNTVHKLPIIRHGANELDEKTLKRCARAGQALYRDTASGVLHRPSLKRLFYYQVWRAMAASGDENADHRYWQEKGFSQTTYWPGIRLNGLERTFSAGIYRMFSRIMRKS